MPHISKTMAHISKIYTYIIKISTPYSIPILLSFRKKVSGDNIVGRGIFTFGDSYTGRGGLVSSDNTKLQSLSPQTNMWRPPGSQ